MDNIFKKVELIKEVFSDEEYFSNKDYVSYSGLKLIKKSPRHFIEREDKKTDALTFGSAYHLNILQPELFNEKYYVINDRDIVTQLLNSGSKNPRASNSYKEWVSLEQVSAGDREILDLSTYLHLEAMKRVIYSHRYARALCTDGVVEKGLFVYAELHNRMGFYIKLKPDLLNVKKRITLDLKTTADASKKGFAKEAAEYDYPIQAALYNDIIDHLYGDGINFQFLFIAQEKTRPYNFNIFEPDHVFINTGRYEAVKCLEIFYLCKENDWWPGYQIFCNNKYGIVELELPPWAIRNMDYYKHN
jgi:exodeoxyribonuclease VIII